MQIAPIEVGKRVTLMPVPFASEDNLQTEQGRLISTGPLPQLTAKIVERGPHDAVHTYSHNNLINALLDAVNPRSDGNKTLWRRAAGTAFVSAPKTRAQAAKQEYVLCWQNRLAQLHDY